MFPQLGPVYAATGDELRRAYERAISRGLEFAVFTGEMFTTGNDGANRAERKVADKVVKGLKFHP